jgi:hypothetical protein
MQDLDLATTLSRWVTESVPVDYLANPPSGFQPGGCWALPRYWRAIWSERRSIHGRR